MRFLIGIAMLTALVMSMVGVAVVRAIEAGQMWQLAAAIGVAAYVGVAYWLLISSQR